MCGSVHASAGAVEARGFRFSLKPKFHAVISSPMWMLCYVAQAGLELDQIS